MNQPRIPKPTGRPNKLKPEQLAEIISLRAEIHARQRRIKEILSVATMKPKSLYDKISKLMAQQRSAA